MHSVTRRSFLASVMASAGSLLLPGLIVRPKVDLHRMLRGFCDPYSEHAIYQVSKPWVQDGRSFATDRRAMAWIDATPADACSTARRVPNAVKVVRSIWPAEPHWRPLPPLRLVGPEQFGCPICDWQECPTCESFATDDRGDPCRDCYGLGYLADPACPICHGSHERRAYATSVPIGNRLLNPRLYQLIAQVPDVRVSLESDKDAAVWKSDIGIHGITMLLYRD